MRGTSQSESDPLKGLLHLYLQLALCHATVHEGMDLLHGIKQRADGFVSVKRIHEQCHVLA